MKQLLLVLVLFFTGCAATTYKPPKSELELGVSRLSSGVCGISSDGYNVYGSGVVLDTGYVLTAAHVVDRNKNNYLDFFERSVDVVVQGERIKGIVVVSSKWKSLDSPDVAVILPLKHINSYVHFPSEFQYKNIPLGTEIITSGHMRGSDFPIVSGGYLGKELNSCARRTTIEIYKGNSGGAVLTKRGGIFLGLITRMSAEVYAVDIPYFDLVDGKLVPLYRVELKRKRPLSFDSRMVTVEAIRKFLEFRNMHEVLGG